MSTETNVQQVKVNLMTQAQYDGATKNQNEFYVITDQDYITETELESKGYLTSVPSEYVTETELESKGYLTKHQDISGKQDILTQNAQATSSAISLVSNSNYYTIKPTSATTFTFPSVSAGKVYTFELKVTLSSVYSLTFPSSVVWMNGEAPDMSEVGVYFLVFRTDDGGNTWYGNSQGRWVRMVTLTFTASSSTDTSFNISQCTLSLSASGYSQSGNSITVPAGTPVSYTCTATGMQTASGTIVADSNKTVVIPMTSNVGCVLYNTEVLYTDGTSKTAEEVQVGDSIMTYNIETKQMEPDIVEAVIPNEKDDVIKITFEDDSYVELTSGHPLLSDHGWVSYDNTKTRRENLSGGEELSQLEVGDKIMTSAGSYIVVKSIEEEYSLGKQRVYDFMMKKNHNFFGGGCSPAQRVNGIATSILMHNVAVTGGG